MQGMRIAFCLLLAACGSDFQISAETQELIVSPDLSDLGLIAVGDTLDVSLSLAAPQGQVQIFTADVLNIAGDAFVLVDETLPVVPAQDTASLTIQYAPTTVGYHWAEVTIKTSEGEENDHTVIVRGEADVVSGRLWPSLVDFGPVEAGTTATQAVTVVNEGRVPLTITASSFDNGLFALDEPLPLIVSADSTVEVLLQASPDDLSEQTGEGSLAVSIAEPLALTLRVNACSTASGDLYDSDGDGFGFCASDCDDFDAAASPGELEVCDDIDNDCDGTIDEGTECVDDDGDGLSEDEGDCNDSDPNISPDHEEELANGIDDDCDGITDDGTLDEDGDGYASSGGDCDDDNADAWPGGEELADGVDNDCDGTIDEGTVNYDDDGDGYTETDGDCDDSDAATHPDAAEAADWEDNDCDGTVDEGTVNYDDDGDGYTETGGDCDDSDASANPGEIEIDDDGIDNDCSGSGT